jgi:hypothetical protein
MICELCGRDVLETTEHHLVPRSTHRVKRVRAMHTFEAMHTTASLCQPCHRAMHQFWPEKTLATSYYSIELLLAEECIRRHVAFVRKQRPGYRMKRSHRGRAK